MGELKGNVILGKETTEAQLQGEEETEMKIHLSAVS